MLFGSGTTVRPWRNDPRIEIHGPGYSKLVFGPDQAERWAEWLDLMVTSVAANGGRSCINASSVRTPAHGRELAVALAERLAADRAPFAVDDRAGPAGRLSRRRRWPRGIDAAIERGLQQGGAEDVTARFRGPQRCVEFEGGTYLLPTVIYCQDLDHPLANQEYLFPFVSVSGCAGRRVGVNARTEPGRDGARPRIRDCERELLARADIGRLNLGPVPTTVLQWDQPHEGNLFAHLFQQRAFQRERFASA